MSDKTGIEWTDATWNPIRGCSRVSEGCRHCYAETVAKRFSGPGQPYEGLIAKGGQWNGQIMVVEHKLDEPCRWTRPRMIFVNSMSDLFHPNVPFEVVAGIFGVMAAASWHTFQVLTKRPGRALEFFQWLDNHRERQHFDAEALRQQHPGHDWRPFFLADMASRILPNHGEGLRVDLHGEWPLSNVWMGVSVENQDTAGERVPLLLEIPAAVRWISAEPLLGPVSFQGMWVPYKDPAIHQNMLERVDWVVVGGESGKKARPMHPDWALTLRDQCAGAEVPFLFKQWGEWIPMLGHAEGVSVRGEKHIFDDGTVMGWAGKKAAETRLAAMTRGVRRAREWGGDNLPADTGLVMVKMLEDAMRGGE